MKYKYHRIKDGDIPSGRCVGKHCLICWMLGREVSLYGDKIISCDEGGYVNHSVRCERLLNLDIWSTKPSPDRLLEHWLNWIPNNPCPMPALDQTLNSLSDMRLDLGIITNGSLNAQKTKIDSLGIGHYFTRISISEEMGIKKPDP